MTKTESILSILETAASPLATATGQLSLPDPNIHRGAIAELGCVGVIGLHRLNGYLTLTDAGQGIARTLLQWYAERPRTNISDIIDMYSRRNKMPHGYYIIFPVAPGSGAETSQRGPFASLATAVEAAFAESRSSTWMRGQHRTIGIWDHRGKFVRWGN